MAQTAPLKAPFPAVGAHEFKVLRLTQGEEYDVLEVSPDGLSWRARNSKGQVGWIPAKYCQPIDGADPVKLTKPAIQPVLKPQIYVDPAHSSLSESLLSWLHDVDDDVDSMGRVTGDVTTYAASKGQLRHAPGFVEEMAVSGAIKTEIAPTTAAHGVKFSTGAKNYEGGSYNLFGKK